MKCNLLVHNKEIKLQYSILLKIIKKLIILPQHQKLILGIKNKKRIIIIKLHQTKIK